MHTESEINLKHTNKHTKKNPKLSKLYDLCFVKKSLSWNRFETVLIFQEWAFFHVTYMMYSLLRDLKEEKKRKR